MSLFVGDMGVVKIENRSESRSPAVKIKEGMCDGHRSADDASYTPQGFRPVNKTWSPPLEKTETIPRKRDLAMDKVKSSYILQSTVGSREPTPRFPRCTRMLSLRISDDKGVKEFLEMRLRLLQQQANKRIAKDWIKAICPRKQAIFPYQNKQRMVQKGESPLVPSWWPDTSLCEFTEPDHIDKKQRTSLNLHLLCLRPSVEMLQKWNKDTVAPHPIHEQHGWTAFLQHHSDPSLLANLEPGNQKKNNHAIKLFEDLYKVARMQEDFKKGALNGNTMYHWVPSVEESRARERMAENRPFAKKRSAIFISDDYTYAMAEQPNKRLKDETFGKDSETLDSPSLNQAHGPGMKGSPVPSTDTGKDVKLPKIGSAIAGHPQPKAIAGVFADTDRGFPTFGKYTKAIEQHSQGNQPALASSEPPSVNVNHAARTKQADWTHDANNISAGHMATSLGLFRPREAGTTQYGSQHSQAMNQGCYDWGCGLPIQKSQNVSTAAGTSTNNSDFQPAQNLTLVPALPPVSFQEDGSLASSEYSPATHNGPELGTLSHNVQYATGTGFDGGIQNVSEKLPSQWYPYDPPYGGTTNTQFVRAAHDSAFAYENVGEQAYGVYKTANYRKPEDEQDMPHLYEHAPETDFQAAALPGDIIRGFTGHGSGVGGGAWI